MARKHISRDFSAHRKSVVRPTDEYIMMEVFSYDPADTMYYSHYESNISTINASVTQRLAWSCYQSADDWNRFSIDCPYAVDEYGEYRVDILYECKDNRNMTGFLQIFNGDTKINEETLVYDGEKSGCKRLTCFYELDEGTYTFRVRVPVNCWYMGTIIRKIKKFTGDNVDSAGTNLMFTAATISKTDDVKPSEASITIAYDDDLVCADSPSGFYIDYRDELNIYTKDDDGNLKQIFGGYISSILPSSDYTTMTVTGADRLVDCQNRYVLDSMYLLGGTAKNEEYMEDMYYDFDSYGEALKYLCTLNETTLQNNINENYLVAGEAYDNGIAATFGTAGNVTNVHASNGEVSESENFVTLRNNPQATNLQIFYLYDYKDYNINPIEITDYPNFYLTYGLGDPKTETETTASTTTLATESASTSGYSQYGVSSDGTQIMAIGRPSASGESKYGYKFYKSVFQRKCPFCGSSELYWSIFWAGNETSNYGTFPATGRKEGGSAEGHIFCKSCDADFSCINGSDHSSPPRKSLTRVSGPTASSKEEAYQLKNSQVSSSDSSSSSSTVSADTVFQAITDEAFNYKYSRGTSSSWADMQKTGSGDCWAFSELIFTRLKERNVSCRIMQYPTGSSSRHRSVQYKDANNEWAAFPYRTYGWNTKYNNNLNDTTGQWSGTVLSSFEGGTITNATASASGSTKITNGYDKDKPFKAVIQIYYATEPGKDAETNVISMDFSLDPAGRLPNEFPGITPIWINNVVKQGMVNAVQYIRANEDNYEASVYLHMVKMKTYTAVENWYSTDNIIDNSSCKMDLYGFGFNNGTLINPKDLSSCGKTVQSEMSTLIDESGYLIDMEYSKHRKDDIINFKVDNQSEPAFTATEGDDNNILSWDSISYTPVSNLYNTSVYVYKSMTSTGSVYNYTNCKDSKSVLNYGELMTLASTSDVLGDKEAYYNARNANSNFNYDQTYSYSITVPNTPDLNIGDLVKIVADAKKLNTIKKVSSVKVTYSYSSIPRIKTTLGLGELSPDLQLKKQLRELRESAKTDSTLFSSSASACSDSDVFTWES